jgi:hypothetical protein
MPAVSLDTAGAAELAELLHFRGGWLAADRDRLDASLRRCRHRRLRHDRL